MKKFAIASGLLVVLSMAMIGCGGDDDEGSGLDRSKAITAVTVEEANTFCNYVEGQVNPEDAQKVACYVGAIFASELDPSVNCETAAQACLDEPITDGEACELSADDISGLPACASMVTVGEYEDCQVATLRVLSDLADSASCTSDLSGFLDIPSECQSIMNKCPELLETEDETLL